MYSGSFLNFMAVYGLKNSPCLGAKLPYTKNTGLHFRGLLGFGLLQVEQMYM